MQLIKTTGTKKVVGLYSAFGKRSFLINDIELIKDVMIKDFDSFTDRRPFFGENTKYLSEMLLSLKGDKWRAMRTMTSPTFTSGKLRGMMPLMEKTGKDMIKYLQNLAKSNEAIDLKKLMSLYTADVTASTGFGIDVDAFNNPDGVFIDHVRFKLHMQINTCKL